MLQGIFSSIGIGMLRAKWKVSPSPPGLGKRGEVIRRQCRFPAAGGVQSHQVLDFRLPEFGHAPNYITTVPTTAVRFFHMSPLKNLWFFNGLIGC